MYAEMFDGLRSYYARYQSRRAAAGFHAAMTMSFICCIAIGSVAVLIDYCLNGSTSKSATFFENRIVLILVGALVAYAHVMFGKRTGRYNSLDPAKSSRWKRIVALYGCSSGALLIGAIFVSLR